jgi:hypothetical protein
MTVAMAGLVTANAMFQIKGAFVRGLNFGCFVRIIWSLRKEKAG